MSQADNLLNSMSIDEEAVYVTEPVAEKHIVIGNDRYIVVPDELKRIAVEHDHDIETITFDCPRYWDNHDMSKMQVYINYLLPNGDPGSYLADNISVDGDIMHFEWTISSHVTQMKGSISFLVCVKKTDADGNEEKHWNSELCRDLYVSEGLETVETVVSQHPDIVTQLLTRMDTVEQSAVDANDALSYRDDAQSAASTASEAAGQAFALAVQTADRLRSVGKKFANPMTGTVSGAVVRMDDVNPVDHSVYATVASKNLFDVSKFVTTDVSEYGYISSVGENYIVVTTPETYQGNGNCGTTLKLIDICPRLIAGKSYTLSGLSPSTNKCIYLRDTDKYWNFGTTRVVTSDDLQSRIAVYGFSAIHNDGYGECKIENIQLELGNTVTDYEPYIDLTSVTVTACGKNILTKHYYDGNNMTRDGITATVNTDGSVHLVGTATTNVYYRLAQINLGNSPILAGNSNGVWALTDCIYDSANRFIYHQVSKDQTVDKTIYPQVEYGTVRTTYETPIDKITYTPAADGTVEIDSIAPVMTIFADEAGVNIEAEYSRDSNVVIGEIHTMLDDILTRVERLEQA